MNHTRDCREKSESWKRKKAAFEAKWPNHCRECWAWGGFYSSCDPSPSGVGLGSGRLEFFDTCPACVDEGKCPRCLETITETEDGLNCSSCGWTDESEGVPPHPECFCEYGRHLEAEGVALQ